MEHIDKLLAYMDEVKFNVLPRCMSFENTITASLQLKI